MRNRVSETATLSMGRLFGIAGSRAPSRAMLAYDASLAWATLLLLAIGLVMVYSASIAMAESSAQTGHRSWYYLARHGVFVAIGLVAALCAFQVPVKAWEKLAPWLFVAGIALLVLVLVPGHRPQRQRLAPLAVAVRRQRPAVRVHEARRRALRGELRRAQGRLPACAPAAAPDDPARASRRCSRRWSRSAACCCSSPTSARSSSSSRSASRSCSSAASTGGCSSACPRCCRSRSARSSSRRRTGCSA
jgi:hypothetical protein